MNRTLNRYSIKDSDLFIKITFILIFTFFFNNLKLPSQIWVKNIHMFSQVVNAVNGVGQTCCSDMKHFHVFLFLIQKVIYGLLNMSFFTFLPNWFLLQIVYKSIIFLKTILFINIKIFLLFPVYAMRIQNSFVSLLTMRYISIQYF